MRARISPAHKAGVILLLNAVLWLLIIYGAKFTGTLLSH